uniref:LIM zinc-binding domain-containing protein n=1 Tax=Naja naja TaxID=35670 RepID=A0A8C6XT13_NAJNA
MPSSLCSGCEKPITGRCITAMGRKFHPEHFVCAFCLKQLNKGTFKEQNEKPYCHPWPWPCRGQATPPAGMGKGEALSYSHPYSPQNTSLLSDNSVCSGLKRLGKVR